MSLRTHDDLCATSAWTVTRQGVVPRIWSLFLWIVLGRAICPACGKLQKMRLRVESDGNHCRVDRAVCTGCGVQVSFDPEPV